VWQAWKLQQLVDPRGPLMRPS